MLDLQQILAWVGGAGLTIGTAAIASFALFRWLGKRWIEDQFERSLEHFRHEKMRELEALRADLNTKLNRSGILQEKEFEVLPRTYRMLAEAHGEVANFTSPLQSYSDVDRMTMEQLAELLDKEGFSEYEKSQIIGSNPSSAIYQDLEFWKRYSSANKPYREFNNYLIVNSIFMDDDLRKRFEDVRDLMFKAMKEAEFEKRYPDPRPDRWKAREALRDQGDSKIESIRNEVRRRLSELKTLDGLVT